MNKSKFLKNVVFGFGGQLIVIILGIIIPRIMITSYGSDVNGLVSTVSQIFAYMALLEAGIGQAARNALYEPIAKKDQRGISYIVSVARRYFRRITRYYAIGVMILSFLLPIVLKTNVDNIAVFLIVFFEGMSGVISFFFIQTQTMLLSADGKEYVSNGVNTVNKTISYIFKIILSALGINIVFLQFVYFLITIGKTVFYHSYFKRHYSWIDYGAAPRAAKLKDRNAYIITEIAWTMFSSTDMIVLSIFMSTKISSVYGVYNMVFSNLNVLLNAVYMSVNYMLGQTYHEDIEKYVKIHDVYTSVFMGGMTVLMSLSYMLIIPFIKIYTNGVSDVNYVYTSLPILFCLVQLLSWSRYITGNLTAVAGYARQTSRISLVEALVNIVFSILLVNRFGIVGVLAATVIALPLKVIYCMYISDKIVLRRSCKKTIGILCANFLLFAAAVFLESVIKIEIVNIAGFIKYGIVFSLVFGTIGVFINALVNKECIQYARNIIKK